MWRKNMDLNTHMHTRTQFTSCSRNAAVRQTYLWHNYSKKVLLFNVSLTLPTITLNLSTQFINLQMMPQLPRPRSLGATLLSGWILRTEQLLESGNGHLAIMQEDGNFVLYRDQTRQPKYARWATGTNGKGKGPYEVIMQQDGNLVLYDSNRTPLWASHTMGKGTPPYRATLQHDGEFSHL